MRVVLGYMDYAVVLNVAVFPDFDTVDITCMHVPAASGTGHRRYHVTQHLIMAESGECAPATAMC